MFHKAAIIVNKTKNSALDFAQKFAQNIKDYISQSTIFADYPLSTNSLNGYDLCVTIGGDGTLLGIAPTLAVQNIPVFAINHGSLGFFSSSNTENAVSNFVDIQNNKFVISERTLLQSTAQNTATALNEVVIRNPNCARTIKFSLSADGNLVTSYTADGLIISSASGSTAYNLSAGGPILSPEIDALIVTPICPHSGHKTSFVLPTTAELTVKAKSEDFAIYCDSNFAGNSSQVSVKTSPNKLKLIKLQRHSFFETLHQKLGF